MAEADTVLPDVDDNAIPSPVEIDIESGEVSDAVTPPVIAPAAAPAKAAIPRPQARIRELTDEVRNAKSYAQQVEEENRRLKEENAAAKQAQQHAERAGMENYAQRVKSDLESASDELRRAKDAGDTAAEVVAQTKLAKAAAADSDVDSWRATLPKDQPQQQAQPQAQPQQQPRQQPQQDQPVPPEVFEFIQQNPWFDAVQRDTQGRPLRDPRTQQFLENPDFDPELHDAAMLIDKRIQRQIRLGHKPKDYAASPEYFQEIKDDMLTQFPELAGEEEPVQTTPRTKTPPMAAARQPVAPAARSGMPGQNNGSRSSSKITLTSEEVQFVNGLVDNNAMRYPNNHPDPTKRGKKMEYKDAYIDYAKRAAETRQPSQS